MDAQNPGECRAAAEAGSGPWRKVALGEGRLTSRFHVRLKASVMTGKHVGEVGHYCICLRVGCKPTWLWIHGLGQNR